MYQTLPGELGPGRWTYRGEASRWEETYRVFDASENYRMYSLGQAEEHWLLALEHEDCLRRHDAGRSG